MIQFIWLIFATITSMIGYTIHNSIVWSIFNFVAAPLSWVWWFFNHEVSLSVVKTTFNWFLK